MGKKKAQYPVKFFKGTAQQYNATTPNDFCFYFITDQNKIYLGDVQLSNVEVYNRINQINNLLEDMAKISIKTTDEWRAIPQVSKKGDIYIFSDRNSKIVNDEVINIPGIKIGDGNAYIMDLPSFIVSIYQDTEWHMINEILPSEYLINDTEWSISDGITYSAPTRISIIYSLLYHYQGDFII